MALESGDDCDPMNTAKDFAGVVRIEPGGGRSDREIVGVTYEELAEAERGFIVVESLLVDFLGDGEFY